MEKSVFCIRNKYSGNPIKEIVLEDQRLINDYLEKQCKLGQDDERYITQENLYIIAGHFAEYVNNPQMYPLWTNETLINPNDGPLTVDGKIIVIEAVSILAEIILAVDWDTQILSFFYTRVK